jgi:hypothetical protein
VPAGFQAFADPDTGAVTAVDADMSFNSSSVRLVVVGRGPLGAFTAKVSAVQMEGRLHCPPAHIAAFVDTRTRLCSAAMHANRIECPKSNMENV